MPNDLPPDFPEELREPVHRWEQLAAAARREGLSTYADGVLNAHRYDALLDEVARLRETIAHARQVEIDGHGFSATERERIRDRTKIRVEVEALTAAADALDRVLVEVAAEHDRQADRDDLAEHEATNPPSLDALLDDALLDLVDAGDVEPGRPRDPAPVLSDEEQAIVDRFENATPAFTTPPDQVQ